MTDQELNEKIARLMGWTTLKSAGVFTLQHSHPKDGRCAELPDYLAPTSLAELLKLAESVFPNGDWDLGTDEIIDPGGGTTSGRVYTAAPDLALAREGNAQWWVGKTPSQALARAIVAHAEACTP